jgi:tryptophanyl-tRNA synthetase
MSLQEPHLKMSKSHQDHRSRILLTDNPDEVFRKVMAALTDSENSVSYDPVGRPGVANLLQLLSYFSPTSTSPERLGEIHARLNLGSLKALVSHNISAALACIRLRYEQIMAEDDGRYLDHVAVQGAEKACESAEETMAVVRKAIGL